MRERDIISVFSPGQDCSLQQTLDYKGRIMQANTKCLSQARCREEVTQISVLHPTLK